MNIESLFVRIESFELWFVVCVLKLYGCECVCFVFCGTCILVTSAKSG